MPGLDNIKKGKFLETLKGAGANPADYRCEDHPSVVGCNFFRKDSDYAFSIGFYQTIRQLEPRWNMEYRPSSRTPVFSRDFVTWDMAIYSFFKDWATYVEELVNTPDPWKTIEEMPSPELRVDPSTENTLLSVIEYEQITKGLLEIKQLFLEQTKTVTSQTVEVSTKLDKLIEDGKRMGRKDWFNQIVSVIASIVVSCSLTQDTTKQAWQILKHSVNGVVTLAQKPVAKVIKDISK